MNPLSFVAVIGLVVVLLAVAALWHCRQYMPFRRAYLKQQAGELDVALGEYDAAHEVAALTPHS